MIDELKYIISSTSAKGLTRRLNGKKYKHIFEYINTRIPNVDQSMTLMEQIYLILNSDVKTSCKYGNKFNFDSLDNGYKISCGPAGTCECIRKIVSDNVSKTRQMFSDDKLKEIREKTEVTNLERYGDKHGVFNLLETREKTKQTCIEKYGVDHPFKAKEVKDRAKQTRLEKYGAEHMFELSNIQDQIKDTVMERYGVGSVMQVPEFHIRQQESAFGFKKYEFPSGRIENVQGYESQMIDTLLLTYHEDDLIINNAQMPEIWWYDENNIEHRYYPDIYIPSENKIIEVKSNWTNSERFQYKIQKKLEATIEAGFDIEVVVIDD